MRFLYGVIAIALWVWFLDYCVTSGGMIITDNQTILTMAIVAAGAMAGGGD